MDKRSTFLQLKEGERERRKELILDAAVKLFTEHPFSNIGMREIAKEAGISPASIYRYFSSRDAILMEVLGQEIQEGEQLQIERLERGAASIEEIAIGIIDFFLDRESMLQMLSHFMLQDKVDPEIQDRFQSAKRYFLEHFEKLMLDAGVAPGNVQLFSHSFFASILGILMVFKNFEGDMEECRQQLHQMARLTARVFKSGLPESSPAER